MALVGRTKIVIEKKDVGIHRGSRARDFFELARANQCGRIRPIASLQNLSHHLRPDTLCQGTKFGARLVRIELRNSRLAVGPQRSPGLCRLHRGCFARDCRLRRDSPLRRAASARANIDSHQKCAFALRLLVNGPQRHTSASTRGVAEFLGMRTSQTENALSFGAGARSAWP